MKSFRKNEEGKFICEECGLKTTRLTSLSHHIKHKHIYKDYFDKWIKDENDGKCNVCGKQTQFINISNGYKKYCCKECEYEVRNNSIKNVYNLHGKEINEKRKQTNINNFGVDNPSKCTYIKKKKEETCMKNHNVKFGFNQIEKNEKTMMIRYGVKYSSQSIDILEKQQKSARTIHQFKDTNLTYQGSYEKDFLEKYYNIIKDLQKGPTLKYILNKKIHTYHSDFFVPYLNLVIEIKNSYFYKRDKKEINQKKKATIANGFNYILIIDKNYKKFDKLLLNQI